MVVKWRSSDRRKWLRWIARRQRWCAGGHEMLILDNF